MPDDSVETTAVLIRRHYRNIGVTEGWNAARFKRLCLMLNVTAVEMGALVALEKHELMRQLKKNRFMPTVSLHFTIIEAAILEERLNKKPTEIIPFSKLSVKSRN